MAQGYKINNTYVNQDNQSAILLEKMAKNQVARELNI